MNVIAAYMLHPPKKNHTSASSSSVANTSAHATTANTTTSALKTKSKAYSFMSTLSSNLSEPDTTTSKNSLSGVFDPSTPNNPNSLG